MQFNHRTNEIIHNNLIGNINGLSRIRFNDAPGVSTLDSDVVFMASDVNRMHDVGFRFHLGCVPALDDMRTVVVLGYGLYDGADVAYVYDHGDYRRLPVNSVLIYKEAPDWGFQATYNNDHNLAVYVTKVCGCGIFDLYDQDGDNIPRGMQWQASLEAPHRYINDIMYWRERVQDYQGLTFKHNNELCNLEHKFNEFKKLIASRIQADGSKVMFKGKQHFVDLPADFASELMRVLFPESEKEV